jgi:hypothetical protein
MNNENDLIKRLMVSKAIMDKHNTMGRGGIPTNINQTPMVEDYQAPASNYNLPEEFVSEQKIIPDPQPLTADRIMGSKLPDAIKQLMIENPISQPTSMNGGTTLSDDLVEKAARLMNNGQTPITETRQKQTPQQSIPSITADDIRSIVRETMEEVLKENGLLVESTTKTNEQFKFRVGQHMFEGKLSKIRKISE